MMCKVYQKRLGLSKSLINRDLRIATMLSEVFGIGIQQQ